MWFSIPPGSDPKFWCSTKPRCNWNPPWSDVTMLCHDGMEDSPALWNLPTAVSESRSNQERDGHIHVPNANQWSPNLHKCSVSVHGGQLKVATFSSPVSRVWIDIWHFHAFLYISIHTFLLSFSLYYRWCSKLRQHVIWGNASCCNCSLDSWCKFHRGTLEMSMFQWDSSEMDAFCFRSCFDNRFVFNLVFRCILRIPDPYTTKIS